MESHPSIEVFVALRVHPRRDKAVVWGCARNESCVSSAWITAIIAVGSRRKVSLAVEAELEPSRVARLKRPRLAGAGLNRRFPRCDGISEEPSTGFHSANTRLNRHRRTEAGASS